MMTPTATKIPRRGQKALIGALSAFFLILTGVLYMHGSTWWYAPIAVAAASAGGHLLIAVGALAGVSKLLYRGSGKRAVPHHGGQLIRRPKLYDWLVIALSVGRERQWRAAWLELAELKPGHDLLDVGCGTGTLLLAAAERVGPTGSLNGLEPAPEMVEHARQKAAQGGIEVEFTAGSASELPYADGSFDVGLCTLVLHHLPLDVQVTALREIRRVLRPGGRVLVIDMQHKSPGVFQRFQSLITVLHGKESGRLIDIVAELEVLGFGGIGQHDCASSALVAIRADLPSE